MSDQVKIDVKRGRIAEASAEVVVVNLYSGVKTPDGPTAALDAATGGAITRALATGDFKGGAGEMLTLYPETGPQRVLVAGLGAADGFDLATARKVGGGLARRLRALKVKSAASILHGGDAGLDTAELTRALTEGLVLGLYHYDNWFRDGRAKPLQLATFTWVEAKAPRVKAMTRGAELGRHLAEGMNLTRDLVNGPPNDVTPTHLANTAKALGRKHGFKVKIMDRAQCEKMGMGAFMAVARAAVEPPKFIVMEHRPEKAKGTVCLVGKGLTFDTGGISLKPAAEMDLMKYDMGGSGAVLGAMDFVGSRNIPLIFIAIIGSTENMPGGAAYKPGDILTSMAGVTIEVKNTDAEGRLVLADCLTYAERFEPDAVIDLATLTGACVIALGTATAAMGNDEWLLEQVKGAADTSGERLWPLPLWPEYREQVKSSVADLKNSAGREAGSITAGAFLGAFTNNYRWVHLDVAGAAWNTKPTGHMEAGAAAGGVRTLAQFLMDWKRPRGKGPQPGPSTTLRSLPEDAPAGGSKSGK